MIGDIIQKNVLLKEIKSDYDQITKPIDEFISIYTYRPFSYPFVKLGELLKLTPNFFTAVALLTGLITAFFYFKNNLFIAGILLFFKNVFDNVDGSLARKTKQFSKFGEKFDGFSDTVSMAAIFLGIAFGEFQIYHDYSIFP
ncbi:MAG: CDP-alcohol phosphatidyltransferase family protein, partial [Promethearchaeota archaeon]